MSEGRAVDRVLVVVCDSLGVGEAPDAAAYGDAGANTVGHVAAAVGGLAAPNLARLGLGRLTRVAGVPPGAAGPGTAHGRLTERSAGKDTTTGHWELCGVVLGRPFPTYPDGFPPEVIRPFERVVGARVLGNEPASGTEIIERLGEEHLRTGRPIVYTSGDSVFQVACHVSRVPLETLYDWCRAARRILDGDNRVGRVIARPFTGPRAGKFTRTPDRRDFSVAPPGRTVLDFAVEQGIAVYGVGKIGDIFGTGPDRVPLLALGHRGRRSFARVPGAARTEPGLHEPGRLRLEVRSPKRSGGVRALHRVVRQADTRAGGGRPGRARLHHRRPRLRSDRPVDRPHARARSGARLRPGRGGAGGSGDAGELRRPGRDGRRVPRRERRRPGRGELRRSDRVGWRSPSGR